MQKMLVILVLVLIGAVAILSFSVYSLRDDLGALRLTQGRSHFRSQPRDTNAVPVPANSGVDQRELQSLRIKVADLSAKYGQVRQSLDRTLARLAAYRVREEDGDGGGFDEPGGAPLPGRSRGTDGSWDISPDEIEYAIALQKKVDRKRRLDSAVRSATRRLDGLIEKGELEPIPEEHAERFNETVARFLTESDDLMTSFFREPSEEIRQLEAKDRREMLKTERERLQAQAQNELAGMLGDEQAQTVADAMFRRSWRYNSGRNRRGNNRLPRQR